MLVQLLADERCEGRLAFILEGGYHLEVLSHSILNTLKVLLGDEDIVDPLGPSLRPEHPIYQYDSDQSKKGLSLLLHTPEPLPIHFFPAFGSDYPVIV